MADAINEARLSFRPSRSLWYSVSTFDLLKDRCLSKCSESSWWRIIFVFMHVSSHLLVEYLVIWIIFSLFGRVVDHAIFFGVTDGLPLGWRRWWKSLQRFTNFILESSWDILQALILLFPSTFSASHPKTLSRNEQCCDRFGKLATYNLFILFHHIRLRHSPAFKRSYYFSYFTRTYIFFHL